MGRASKLWKLVVHLGAWWMVLDMVMDGLTVTLYRSLCLEGELECWLWPVGVLFLLLPTLVATLVACTCGWPGEVGMDCCMTVAGSPLYSLFAPLLALWVTGRALCCGDTEYEERRMEEVAYAKLPEVVCEALPQVSNPPLTHPNLHPGGPDLVLHLHHRIPLGAGGRRPLHLDPPPKQHLQHRHPEAEKATAKKLKAGF